MDKGMMMHKMSIALETKLRDELPDEASREHMYRKAAFILKEMALSILSEIERKVGKNEIFGDGRCHIDNN